MTKILQFLKKYLYGVFYTWYIFGIGIFFKKNRLYIDDICNLLGYFQAVKPTLQKIKIEDLIHESSSITIHIPKGGNGNVSFVELSIISQLTKQINPSNIFEIGTFDGRTTLNLAANSPQNCKVYTLDLPASNLNNTQFKVLENEYTYIDKSISGEKFLNTDFQSKIFQLYGDSATFDFSLYAQKIDLIFIDGSHAYDYVKSDSFKALKMISKRSIILWHDYSWWSDVTKAINELQQSVPEFKMMKHIEGTTLAILDNR